MRLKPLMMALGLGVLAQLPPLAQAAPGTLIKDDSLLAAPSASAARIASLAKNSTVEVLGRQGGWTQVRAGSRTGWVRILSVRTSVSTTSARDLAALTSRREGSQVVAVAGLRGLSEEELKTARFNARELQELERFRVERGEAVRFARAAHLVSRQVAYLPKPAPAGDAGNENVWGWGQ